MAVRARRRAWMSLLSGLLILVLLVILSWRDPSAKSPNKSTRSGSKDGRRTAGDTGSGGSPNHAGSTPYRYRIFSNYNEDDEADLASAEAAKNRKITEPLDLMTFQSVDDQLLYLYDKVLSAPWSPNPNNLALFRSLLLKQSQNHTVQDELILTRQNVKVGDSLPFAFSNTMSKDGVKYYFNVTQTILDEIPEVSPISGKTFKRCSVVGNGGILRNSKCGKDIDRADYVFRSNIPPLRPFSADAGTKSNLSTMNPSVVHKRYHHLKKPLDHEIFVRSLSEYNGMLWLPCVGSHKMVDVCLLAKRSLDGSRSASGRLKTVVSNPNHYIAIQHFWNERNISQFLSTGFYVTHLALATCDEIHLYGFWPFATKVVDSSSDAGNLTVSFQQRTIRYHYFDNLPGPNNMAHSMQDEFGVLVQMHELGMLRLHVHDCED